jgi:hypothetical protein
VQGKEAVERDGRVLARKRQSDLAVQPLVVGVADRSDGGQAIEGAAQHDHDQARIARAGSARQPRQLRPSEHGRAAGEKRASRRGRQLAAIPHGYLH